MPLLLLEVPLQQRDIGLEDAASVRALRAFSLHLHEYLLVPSGRGGAHARTQAISKLPGCFIYAPPPGVVWAVQSPEASVQRSGFRVRSSKFIMDERRL